jgi:hypothetical protein
MSDPDELLEPVEPEQADERRKFWAAVVVRLGLSGSHGVHVRKIPGTRTLGLYIGQHRQ